MSIRAATVRTSERNRTALCAPPAGSTTHDALNKDHPGTAQGSRVVTRLFPPASCYTFYGVISGQFSASGATDAYEPTGIAPRHSDHALTALNTGGPVFGSLPIGRAARASAAGAVGESLFDLIARTNADPTVISQANELAAMVDFTNPDPHAFPLESLDLDGFPVPEPSLVSMLAGGVLWLRVGSRRRPAACRRRDLLSSPCARLNVGADSRP